MDKSIAQAQVHATSLPFEKDTERQSLMQFAFEKGTGRQGLMQSKVFTELAARSCN